MTPRLLREVLRELLASQADMEVIGEVSDPADVPAAAAAARPDVVLVSLDDFELPEEYRRLFEEAKATRILALISAGRWAYLYERGASGVSLGEPSPDDLLEALRRAGRRTADR